MPSLSDSDGGVVVVVRVSLCECERNGFSWIGVYTISECIDLIDASVFLHQEEREREGEGERERDFRSRIHTHHTTHTQKVSS